jgi:hypothetical protein
MKRAFVLLLAASALAGCDKHHPIASDPAAFVTRWNLDVPQPELRLEALGDTSTLRAPIGIWVTYTAKDRSWMAMAPQAAAPIACNELLVATSGLSPDQAKDLLHRLSADNQWTVRDGNLEFYFNPNGGLMCRVTDTSRG